MLFVQKGYCRYAGKKCRLLKVKDGKGYCKKIRFWYGDRVSVLLSEKTGKPKQVSSDINVNIKAPKWCPKSKH